MRQVFIEPSVSRFPVALGLAAALLLAGPTLGEVADAEASTEQQMRPYTEVIESSTGRAEFRMTPIPGGTFRMGAAEDDPFAEFDEVPRIEVEVQPFWMGVHEVTWDEYDLFLAQYEALNERGYEPIPDDHQADAVSFPTPQWEEGIDKINEMGPRDGRPAVHMSQLAARQYTKWLSKKTGRFYRLPTEAEWEYAARAGSDAAYHFGDDPGFDYEVLDQYAWFIENSDDRYQPVGRKQPNAWGLHDTHGNVAEWVLDQYIEDHYERFAGQGVVAAEEVIAWPDTEHPRVVRGGSYLDFPEDLRSSRRMFSERDWREKDPQLPQSIWWETETFWVGFRIVRPLVEPSEEEKLRYWEPEEPRVRNLMMREYDKEMRSLVGEHSE